MEGREIFRARVKKLEGGKKFLGGEKFIERVKNFLGGVKKWGDVQKKSSLSKILENMAKKGELRAEKQQVYHMTCRARVRSMYIPGRHIDS